MFSKIQTRWMAGALLTLGLLANVIGAGAGSASAQTINATSTAQLVSESGAMVAAGTGLTVQGASFEADETVSFWINVPNGTTIPEDSLGQTDTRISGTVIPLNAMVDTDDNGAFTYTVDTSGLPNGDYSLVAHGLTSKTEQVLGFTINGLATTPPLKAEGDTTMVAGAVLAVQGAGYAANEEISLWINVPDGAKIPEESLGQTSTHVDGTVIPLDVTGLANDAGALTYKLDTSGLPSGNYSLVAHGRASGVVNVLSFTIK